MAAFQIQEVCIKSLKTSRISRGIGRKGRGGGGGGGAGPVAVAGAAAEADEGRRKAQWKQGSKNGNDIVVEYDSLILWLFGL